MPAWLVYAILSALFAGVIPILAKIGLRGIDSNLATGLRAWVMALSLSLMLVVMGKWRELPRTTPSMAGYIVLVGLAGAASWVCEFLALRTGPAGPTQAINRLSLIFTLVLAALFLAERLTPRVLLGGALMIAGALLIATGTKR
jgi:bacterial/archaeal transporter family protein